MAIPYKACPQIFLLDPPMMHAVKIQFINNAYSVEYNINIILNLIGRFKNDWSVIECLQAITHTCA